MDTKLHLVVLLCLLGTCWGYPQYQVPKDEPAELEVPNPCDKGSDCVPWQSCINGVINQRGEFSLDLRTKPANYRDLSCGSEGHMCCALPAELLQEEQTSVGVGAGSPAVQPSAEGGAYEGDKGGIIPGVGGGQIISGVDGGSIATEIDGGQIAPVVDGGQITTGVDEGQIISGVYEEQEQATSVIDEGLTSDVDGEIVPEIDETIPTSDVDGGVASVDGGILTSVAEGGKLTSEAVGEQIPSDGYDGSLTSAGGYGGEVTSDIDEGKIASEAEDGKLTSGADGGTIVQAEVDVVVDNELPSVCVDQRYDCVPFFQCKNGVISTDGEGILDERTKPPASCINLEHPTITAVCCLKPIETLPLPPVITCPLTEECLDVQLCAVDETSQTDGTGIIEVRTTPYTECLKADDSKGVCCLPPKKPTILDICPGDSTCLSGSECLGTAIDSSGAFVDFVVEGTWTTCVSEYANAVCCIQPPPKALEVCPGDSGCLSGYECLGQAMDGDGNFVDYTAQGDWTSCVSEFDNAVCCKQPPAPVVNVCTTGSICLPASDCRGQALDSNNKFVSYNSKGSWKYCSEGGYSSGICCINPSDVTLTAADKCGIRNYDIDKRIQSNLAKNEASFGEFPWQAIIFNKTYHFECGASLISNQHVVTAAHCVYGNAPADIRVRFGEWQVNKFDEKLPYVDRQIKKIIIHPDYNGEVKNYFNDIALIELARPVDLKYHINTVCIPKTSTVDGTQCYASGWGKSAFNGKFQHILKKIDLPYVDHKKCESLLRKTRLGKYFKLHESFVCAGGEENKDACFGDGGGPLVCKDTASGQYFLSGITAWGIGCGTKDVPGVYVNVAQFSDWINQTILGEEEQQQAQVPGYGK